MIRMFGDMIGGTKIGKWPVVTKWREMWLIARIDHGKEIFWIDIIKPMQIL